MLWEWLVCSVDCAARSDHELAPQVRSARVSARGDNSCSPVTGYIVPTAEGCFGFTDGGRRELTIGWRNNRLEYHREGIGLQTMTVTEERVYHGMGNIVLWVDGFRNVA